MTTTRYPRAIWKPLPEHASQPTIRPTQAIVHSIVGSARGAFNYFRDSVSLESHFILPKSGVPWQCMDLDRQADANYRANRRPDGTGAHSMETEDNGDPNTDPWTTSQVDEIIAWYLWETDTFDIPRRVCRTPSDPGIGYHTLFGAPSDWTPSRGKTCPGYVRIEQFNDVIVPAVILGQATNQEDDMTPEQEKKLDRVIASLTRVENEHFPSLGGRTATVTDKYGQTGPRSDVWRWAGESVTSLRQLKAKEIATEVAKALSGAGTGSLTADDIERAAEKGITSAMREAFKEA